MIVKKFDRGELRSKDIPPEDPGRTQGAEPNLEAGIDRAAETARILEAVSAGRFQLRGHALRRSDERMLTRENVVNVARTTTQARYQDGKYTHWFVGLLAEGQPGGFTAILEDEVWVVTVFKRTLSRRERG